MILVLGATGMLGQALLQEAAARGLAVSGAARSGAEHAVDVTDLDDLTALVGAVRPDVVVNTVALTDLRACEEHPGRAYAVNARPLAALAELSADLDFRLVQVSTDHFYTGDGAHAHNEADPIRLVNEYARTKHAAEGFALTAPGALVVRTNIVGFRGWAGRPTFAEWVLGALQAGEHLSLFDDFWTSSLPATTLAEALFDLLGTQAAGILNVASSEVANKEQFVTALATAADLPLNADTASVAALLPRRAESIGLDVTRAEQFLGRPLPNLAATVRTLIQLAP
jgi:dTDP-4-dehydrorhamnose reductase